MKRALLLLAHGARDPRWAAPFEEMADHLRLLAPGVEVRLSYLDFLQPGLGNAGDALVVTGVERVDIVPLFLGAGGHVRSDVPRLVNELAARHAGVHWQLHPAIGELRDVIEAMALAALKAVDSSLRAAASAAPAAQSGSPSRANP